MLEKAKAKQVKHSKQTTDNKIWETNSDAGRGDQSD